MSLPESRAWQYHNSTRISFGAGARGQLAGLIKGQRVLLVSTRRGRSQFEGDALFADVLAENVTWVDTVQPNPGLAETQVEIDRLGGTAFDSVVAFGGGSVMDAAKALAAALAPGAGTRDLAALIARPVDHLPAALLPIHAIPTTSGTGSEVTPFATIWDHANHKKLSLASPLLFPKTALVDPELTLGVGKSSTFSTGLDALNQAFESVWNKNRSTITLLMASRAIAQALKALPALHADLGDASARAAMAEASLLAGVCISQTRTALCHSISYPLTAHYDVPHGLACAFTMRAVASLCLEGAPEVLNDLASLTGHGTGQALIDDLGRVLDLLEVATTAHAMLPDDIEKVLALRGEMFTPGRSDNFVVPVDHDTLERIIRAS